MFYGLKRFFDTSFLWGEDGNGTWCQAFNHDRSKNAFNFVASGVLSGLICSFAVAPMDVFKTYLYALQ